MNSDREGKIFLCHTLTNYSFLLSNMGYFSCSPLFIAFHILKKLQEAPEYAEM